MKILLFGSGQLSQQIQHDFTSHELFVIDREHCDITQVEQIEAAFAEYDFELVINAVAYTAVDQAEKEVELAFAVNAGGVKKLAQLCENLNRPLIHISTDYVFQGNSREPYREEDDTKPMSEYGRSKLEGEKYVQQIWAKHIIIRTSWLYGPYGNNFVKNIIRAGQIRDELKIVDDQIGTPTSTASLSQCIHHFCNKIGDGFDHWGSYHFSGEGECTWYEFTKEIFSLLDKAVFKTPLIKTIKTHELKLLAPRPHYAVLDKTKVKTLGVEVANWKEELSSVLPEISKAVL